MSLRNLLISFLFVCFCDFVFAEMTNFSELQAKCGEITQLKEEEIKILNKTRPLVTNDERVKCFIRCVLTELNLMDNNGILTLELVANKNMKNKEHFQACKEVDGTDPCDKALNFQNCVWNQIELQKNTSE